MTATVPPEVMAAVDAYGDAAHNLKWAMVEGARAIAEKRHSEAKAALLAAIAAAIEAARRDGPAIDIEAAERGILNSLGRLVKP